MATLKEQSDQGFEKDINLYFLKVGFCPFCQIKQWAFVQWDIVQWAFVQVGICPSGLLSVPHGADHTASQGPHCLPVCRNES